MKKASNGGEGAVTGYFFMQIVANMVSEHEMQRIGACRGLSEPWMSGSGSTDRTETTPSLPKPAGLRKRIHLTRERAYTSHKISESSLPLLCPPGSVQFDCCIIRYEC